MLGMGCGCVNETLILAVPQATALKAILRDNELKSDIAHPNARGYARLAAAVAALLKKKRGRIGASAAFGKNHPTVRKSRLEFTGSEACSS